MATNSKPISAEAAAPAKVKKLSQPWSIGFLRTGSRVADTDIARRAEGVGLMLRRSGVGDKA